MSAIPKMAEREEALRLWQDAVDAEIVLEEATEENHSDAIIEKFEKMRDDVAIEMHKSLLAIDRQMYEAMGIGEIYAKSVAADAAYRAYPEKIHTVCDDDDRGELPARCTSSGVILLFSDEVSWDSDMDEGRLAALEEAA